MCKKTNLNTLLFLLLGLCFMSAGLYGRVSSFEDAIQAGSAPLKTPPSLGANTIPSPGATPTSLSEQEEEQEPTIYLNFENASLSSVVSYLSERKNFDLIPHKDLQNIKVSLTSRKPMTLTEAWNTLYTLLEANGFTVVEVDGIHRVVSMQDHQKTPLPSYSSAQGVTPAQLPDTDEIVRYLYFCRNIKSAAAKTILDSILAPNAVQVNANLEACIITDKSLSIKSAMRIVDELDRGGLREAVTVIQLKHTSAETVAKLFTEQILGTQQKPDQIRFVNPNNPTNKRSTYFSSDIKLIPEPTLNKIYLLGTKDAIAPIVKFIDEYLDIPVGTATSRIHIKEIKYMAAEKLKVLLEKMIQPPRGHQGKSLVEGDFRFFEDVVITAEQPRDSQGGRGSGNRLVIACNKEDWSRLSSFIDDLDKPQPQVALEVLIADLNMDDTRDLGSQLRTKPGMLGGTVSTGTIGDGSETVTAASFAAQGFQLSESSGLKQLDGNNIASIATSGQKKASILTLGNATEKDIWGAIRTVYNIDHSNIISQPYLVANNNTPCREEITDQKYVPGALTSQSNSSIQVQRQEAVRASVITEITPRINASGTIELSLDLTISEFVEVSGDSPDKRERKITTRALMATGEVLVLGGLTSSRHSNQTWEWPIISKIPLIGNLFRSRADLRAKKSLFIFIRPSIMKPHFEGSPDDYTDKKLAYARHQVLKNDNYNKIKDPIQRWFFRPGSTPIKNKLASMAAGEMPIIDDFASRRKTPKQVHMSKDPYFKSMSEQRDNEEDFHDGLVEELLEEYNPATAAMSMPHVKPVGYVTPGLIEASLPAELLAELEAEFDKNTSVANNNTIAAPPAPLQNMQRRGLHLAT